MFRFGWVIAAAEDLQIWLRFPEATFALYEVPGAEGASEYRSGSVDPNKPSQGALRSAWLPLKDWPRPLEQASSNRWQDAAMPLDRPGSLPSLRSTRIQRPHGDSGAQEFLTSWRQSPQEPQQQPLAALWGGSVHGPRSNSFGITQK